VLTRFAQSGLTVRVFCQREGFSTASFYRWQSILRTPSDESRPQKPANVVNATAGFVDLGALHTGSSRLDLRLDLGGGLLLHLVRS
jgi:hypothetical protein